MVHLLTSCSSSVIGLDSKVDPSSPPGVQPLANYTPVGVTDWSLVVSEEFNHNPTILNEWLLRFHQGGIAWSTRYPDWLAYLGAGNTLHTGNAGLPEQQYYAREGVSTADGALRLTAQRLPIAPVLNPYNGFSGGFRYVSGQINSWPTHNQLYGFFEARVKLPGGLCQWPAFWMFPEEWDPAQYHEIDMMECFEDDSITTFSSHEVGTTLPGLTPYGLGPVTSWHTYGVAWTATELIFFGDGVAGGAEGNVAAVPQIPMFPILNLATRPQATNADYPERMVMEVDYIRIWEAN
jgi:beta-glucanase (GH16 family)